VKTAQNAGVICPNSSEVRANTRYPEAAQKRNITGDVFVEFLVADSGAIDNIVVVGKPNRVLASAAIEATRQFKCLGQTPPARVQVSYSFQMN
jgi:protein TonB